LVLLQQRLHDARDLLPLLGIDRRVPRRIIGEADVGGRPQAFRAERALAGGAAGAVAPAEAAAAGAGEHRDVGDRRDVVDAAVRDRLEDRERALAREAALED